LKAGQYLIKNFKENNNRFWDRSVVGTGHRGILNLQYSIYALSFPLVALSRLREYILGKKQPYVSEDLMR
jgi:squalene-hopene/tetraprenyl-beta-curcumene cyclase